MRGDDDGARAERGRRAQHRADILRIADLVEDDDDGPARCRVGAPQHVVEIGLGERLDFERQPLVDGCGGQDRRKAAVIEHADRRFARSPT